MRSQQMSKAKHRYDVHDDNVELLPSVLSFSGGGIELLSDLSDLL